jgi:hypothetical protein
VDRGEEWRGGPEGEKRGGQGEGGRGGQGAGGGGVVQGQVLPPLKLQQLNPPNNAIQNILPDRDIIGRQVYCMTAARLSSVSLADFFAKKDLADFLLEGLLDFPANGFAHSVCNILSYLNITNLPMYSILYFYII